MYIYIYKVFILIYLIEICKLYHIMIPLLLNKELSNDMFIFISIDKFILKFEEIAKWCCCCCCCSCQ